MTDPTISFVDLQEQRRRLAGPVQERIQAVLEHGQFILGPEVFELEEQLAAFTGSRHVITCASGTDALVMPLMAQDYDSNDAVFVPAFTFGATAEAVLLAGATPYFVDVSGDTFCLCPESLAAAIRQAKSDGYRASAVITVGLFGRPADMDDVLSAASEHGLLVVDDAAQSFGSTYNGNNTGTLADVTATSFFPSKPLGCYGDGGAIFTDDPELADKLRSIRVHGKGRDKYENVRVGLNSRLDTLQAAVLLEKLKIFPDELVARRRVAEKYQQTLGAVCGIQSVPAEVESAWAQFTLVSTSRDQIREKLAGSDIPTAVYYPIPLHRQVAYQHAPVTPSGLETSSKLSSQVLSLPMHPYLTDSQIDKVAALVVEACTKQ